MDKKISEQLDEMAREICDHYCKYPDKWNDEDGDLCESDICKNCPLTRMI